MREIHAEHGEQYHPAIEHDEIALRAHDAAVPARTELNDAVDGSTQVQVDESLGDR
jgi:hypothetical protein